MSYINYNYQDNKLAAPFASHIQWVAVGHTKLHVYNKEQWQINGMLKGAKQTGKFFTRKFAQFFNGHKALTYPSHHNNPLIISHLHMGKIIKAASTIHYHFAFGNIPADITEEDMMTIFSELWVNKANQSHKKLWLKKADETNMEWLRYGHNENKLGEHLGFDMNACFTPDRLGN
jgi:hypothetical protein